MNKPNCSNVPHTYPFLDNGNRGCGGCCHNTKPAPPAPHPTDCDMFENSFILTSDRPYLMDNSNMKYSNMLSVSENVRTMISQRRDDTHINLVGPVDCTHNLTTNTVLNHYVEQFIMNHYETMDHVVPVMKSLFKGILYFHVEDINGGIVYESSVFAYTNKGFMHVTDVEDFLVASLKMNFCGNIPALTYSGSYTLVLDKIDIVLEFIDTQQHLDSDEYNIFYQFTDNNTKIVLQKQNIDMTDPDGELVIASTILNSSTIFQGNLSTRFTLSSTVYIDNITSTRNTFNIWEALNNPTKETFDSLVQKVEYLEECISHIVHKNAYDSIRPVRDHLYDVTYSNLDYKFGKMYLRNRYTDAIGACSAVRKGNFYGRNYDWKYDDASYMIIRVNKSIASKYASIGMCGGIPTLTDEIVNSGEFNELFGVIPFLTLDGINECGVIANLNVVPAGDHGLTSGTHPTIEKKDTICVLMLVRYVLDKFATAAEAVDYLQKYVSVYAPNKEGTLQEEIHVMIADKDETYLIEFIDNRMVVSNMDVAYGGRTYMTNFYLYNTSMTEDNKIDFNSVTPYGSGLERYNLITASFDSIEDVDSMMTCMRQLNFTNAYLEETDPVWKTEFVDRSVGRTILSPDAAFEPILNRARSAYKNRVRDGKTWQTVHTAVYDIESRAMYVVVQEEPVENMRKVSFTHEFTAADIVEMAYMRADIESLKVNVDELKTKTEDLETRVNTLENLDIQETLNSIQTDIESINTSVSSLDSRVTVLENPNQVDPTPDDQTDSSDEP